MSKLAETGAQVEQWCLNHGYTKGHLAAELGVTRQTLHNWIKSERPVPRVLSLSLFALENLDAARMSGEKSRKASKRRWDNRGSV
jgi:hypothetical protein